MAPVQNSHASGTWYLHRKRISERKITLHEEQNHRCGAMVSVRISYLSDDSLRASQIMAIWPSFDSSLEFPSVAPPATLPLPISPSWSPRPSQMVTAAQTGRRARPGATSSWHVPPPYLQWAGDGAGGAGRGKDAPSLSLASVSVASLLAF